MLLVANCFRKKEDGDLSKEWFASVLNNTQYSSGEYNVWNQYSLEMTIRRLMLLHISGQFSVITNL